MKNRAVSFLSFILFLVSLIMGFLAAAGTSALFFGRDVTLTAIDYPAYQEHPAYIVCMLLIIPYTFICTVGTLFGIIFPLNLWLRCPIDQRDKTTRRFLHWYANAIAAATTPNP